MAKLTQDSILRLLDWIYEKAVSDETVGLDSAKELAEYYLHQPGTIKNRVRALIKSQNKRAASLGFLTNFGGIITLPVTLPANITSNLFLQTRMIAAIAYMGGYNLNDPKVKIFVLSCLCGHQVKSIMKLAGIRLSQQLTVKILQKIPQNVLTDISKRISSQLLTKLSVTSSTQVTKLVPIIGGVAGGMIDYYFSATIGKIATNLFINTENLDDNFRG